MAYRRRKSRYPLPLFFATVALGTVAVIILIVMSTPSKVEREAGSPSQRDESLTSRPPEYRAPKALPSPGGPDYAQPLAHPGDEARRLIAEMRQAGSVDLDEAFTQARRFADSGKLTDAHLLYYFAAREGHPASATQLAQMYDPTRYSSATSIMDEPDPGQAYKWYRRATEAGDRTAQQRLTELKLWVEEAAKGGDVEAEQLLLGWK